jgi:hypothetical protein
LFTFSVNNPVKREMPDVPICDEGIAPAIAEEQSGTDGVSQLTGLLTQKVNKAQQCSPQLRSSKPTKQWHIANETHFD